MNYVYAKKNKKNGVFSSKSIDVYTVFIYNTKYKTVYTVFIKTVLYQKSNFR